MKAHPLTPADGEDNQHRITPEVEDGETLVHRVTISGTLVLPTTGNHHLHGKIIKTAHQTLAAKETGGNLRVNLMPL